MSTTSSTTTSAASSDRSRRRATAATLVALGVLLTAVGCASDDDGIRATEAVTAASAGPPPTPEAEPPIAETRPRSVEPPPPATTPAPDPAPSTEAMPTTTPPPEAADPALLAPLQDILAVHHAARDFVGARLAVRDVDGTIVEATAGTPTLDPASGPVDPDVPWNIGSATKAFVAVVVLQLAEEGRIDLDAGIDAYFPYLPAADRITPRQLLNHTSGLAEYLDQPAVVTDPRRSWTPAELIAVAEATGRVGEPGGPHHYANTNYIALGEIIEQATGRPWVEEVHHRIAEPLGMTHTSVITDRTAPGFRIVDGSLVDVTHGSDPSVGGAAGAMQSTNSDLLAFARALTDGSLLSPESRAAMETFVPAEDLSQFGIDHGYGLGLERYAMADMTIIGHMGTGDIGSSYVGFDPTTGTTVAVTTNTATPGPAAIMAVEALTALRRGG